MKSIVIFVLTVCFENVASDFHLQIIHNNDMHAHFVETDTFSGTCPPEFVKDHKCYGGFARVKQAANDAIEEAKKQNISSIFLNAGDSFQGTAYYSLFKWKIVVQLVNSLGFDVMCLGNHEFDDGIDNLVHFVNDVKAPVVTCNLNISSESRLNVSNLMPSTVLNVSGHQIGIVGYLTPETMASSNTENLQIFDEIPKIRAEAQRLKSKGIKIIIGLGHSGFETDINIAKDVEEIDVLVGGHSHSLLYTPKDKPPSTEKAEENYPYIVTQKSGKKVPIVQAGAFTKYIGKLLVTFDDDGNVKSATGNTYVLNSTVKKDPQVDGLVEKWSLLVRDQLNAVKGYTRIFLRKPDFSAGEYESNTGNLITDATVDTAVQKAKDLNLKQWTIAPIAMYQNGGIRSIIDNNKNGGAITLEEILMLLPFDNQLYACQIPGSALREALEWSVFVYDKTKRNNYLSKFLHVSGLKVVYDFTKPAGNRVESVTAVCANCSAPKYEPLNENKIYSIILNEFLMKGGDNFQMFPNNIIRKQKLNCTESDSLAAYIEKHVIVYPIIEGRITVKGAEPNPSMANRNTVSFYLIVLVAAAVSICNAL